ncbi:hypothetical protein C8Q77DRAFT_1110293 [Trametes polyzona]|nr:hypothetical protein C8Q77DRAFT_1110293 [Trametes polyzona]
MSSPDHPRPDLPCEQITPVIELNVPRQFYGPNALACIELSDAVRNDLRIYDGAPHGRYVVADASGSKCYCFDFCVGSDIKLELAKSLKSLATTPTQRQGSNMFSVPPTETRQVVQPRPPVAPMYQPLSSVSAQMQRVMPSHPEPFLVDPARAPQQPPGNATWTYEVPVPSGRDSNSLIPISPTNLSMRGIFYCAEITLDPKVHCANDRDTFMMPADTGAAESWLYIVDYRYITTVGQPATTERPESLRAFGNLTGIRLGDVGKNKDGRTIYRWLDFDKSLVPPDPNGELDTIRYLDGGAVYVRRFHDRRISALFPCWNWETNSEDRRFLVQMPCTVAYAANAIILSQLYDGNLGLALPKVSVLYHPNPGANASNGFVEFCDVLENRQVYSAREFYLRLISPTVGGGDARNFLCFSPRFPCTLMPAFTAPLCLRMYKSDYQRMRAGQDPVSRFWPLGLRGMALRPYELTRSTGEIRYRDRIPLKTLEAINDTITSQSRRDPYVGSGLRVILDSGSVFSTLPRDVVDEIAASWLKNPKDANTKNWRPYYLPSVKHRNIPLHQCDIEFTFARADGGEERLFCPAAPFLSSIWSCRDYYTDNVTRASIPQNAVVCPINPGVPFQSVTNSQHLYFLGMNFHWAAIVHYVGPKVDVRNFQLKDPFVRLAPQRVIQRPPGGDPRGKYKIYTEKDIVFPKDFPLRP